MAGNLPELVPSATNTVEVQDTTFSLDVLGRYICSTWDEAVSNGGEPFDAVVIGAGMFGAYCAEKLYRGGNLRVLVLDAGCFLVSEHVQNLARIGLNTAGAVKVPANNNDPGTRERVWGSPWRSNQAFPGLAYCLGGKSLYWGGWAPRLTAADLTGWPAEIANYLEGSNGSDGTYKVVEREIGVDETTDYISGELWNELRKKFEAAVTQGVLNVDEIEAEAPLAVQGSPPASGLFSFDKYSSAPILIDAIREAAGSANNVRRLFLVPRANVVKLHTNQGVVTRVEVRVNGQQRFLDLQPKCCVIVATSTIESTRLALESFPRAEMGRNLMGHLRSNTVVRIRRSALDPALPKQLEAAALLVRGSTSNGRFHLQVTAAAVLGSDSEAAMFRMIPDIELLDKTLASQDADWIVITLRGIGEMTGDKNASPTNASTSWMDLSDQTDQFQMRRAWVNLVKTNKEDSLWDAMDGAAIALAQKVAGATGNIQYFYNKNGSLNQPGADWHDSPPPKSTSPDRDDPNNKVRDGLGTTHHEAGTLWMGTSPGNSVTELNGRFHHITNAYVAGPALFPTIGSANPSLTALALARRTAAAVVRETAPTLEDGFSLLGDGTARGWKMTGAGRFKEVGGHTLESEGGTGLLWYAQRQFGDFVLKLDWRTFDRFDNSGVYLRFPSLDSDWKVADTQGYEIQIDDRGVDESGNEGSALHRTGAIYKLAPATTLASSGVGNWNTFEIEAKGKSIAVRLNGTPVSNLANGNRLLKGHIGLQNHHQGSRVQFRNIRIKADS
jgi:choline dehydrogenase-like flavoprotein